MAQTRRVARDRGIMDRDKVLAEIRSLKQKVRALTDEIETVKAFVLEDPSPVDRMLKMRDMEVYQKNPVEQLLFPPDISALSRATFFKWMHRYSFRLLLRDIIKHQDRFRIHDLTHFCTPRVARRYCDLLTEMGVILKTGRDYRTVVHPVYSFGQTLEWFVAEMFKREFAAPAIYCATLKGTVSGGDFDVIAAWNRRLVYVEVKSSPPKGIESSEVRTFLSRTRDLQPDVAVLFDDTQLRMKDKVVPMFQQELANRHGSDGKDLFSVERLTGELFHVRDRIFIVNSSKDVVTNFATCLRHHIAATLDERACAKSEG
jgi:hypothetical protein